MKASMKQVRLVLGATALAFAVPMAYADSRGEGPMCQGKMARAAKDRQGQDEGHEEGRHEERRDEEGRHESLRCEEPLRGKNPCAAKK